MSSHVQVIEQDGKPAFYVGPAALWERMREAAEDAQDIADLERFEREDDGVRYPAAVAMAMADGASPLRAWREHRGMTLQALADAAGLSRAYVSQIEGGHAGEAGAGAGGVRGGVDPVGHDEDQDDQDR